MPSNFVLSSVLATRTAEETPNPKNDEQWNSNCDWDNNFNDLHPFLLYLLHGVTNAGFLDVGCIGLEFTFGTRAFGGAFCPFLMNQKESGGLFGLEVS